MKTASFKFDDGDALEIGGEYVGPECQVEVKAQGQPVRRKKSKVMAKVMTLGDLAAKGYRKDRRRK